MKNKNVFVGIDYHKRYSREWHTYFHSYLAFCVMEFSLFCYLCSVVPV